MLNVTEIVKVAASEGTTKAIHLLSQLGYPVDRVSGDYIEAFATVEIGPNDLYDDFLSLWNISRPLTFMACVTAIVNFILINIAFNDNVMNLIASSFSLCVAGITALNHRLVINIIQGLTLADPAYIGYGNVPGIGDVHGITLLANNGAMQLGYLIDPHPLALPEAYLHPRGYDSVRSIVMFNNATESKDLVYAYGLEAQHYEGYTTVCVDPNAESPEIIANQILSVAPNTQVNLWSRSLVCTSYNVNSTVAGYHLPGVADGVKMPMLRKIELGKKAGFKASAADEGEESYDSYYSPLFDEMNAQLDAQQESGNDDISAQGLLEFQPVGSMILSKDDEGAKTLFLTNYINSYGPPVDYLAGV